MSFFKKLFCTHKWSAPNMFIPQDITTRLKSWDERAYKCVKCGKEIVIPLNEIPIEYLGD